MTEVSQGRNAGDRSADLVSFILNRGNAPLSIPKGLRISAQGWARSALPWVTEVTGPRTLTGFRLYLLSHLSLQPQSSVRSAIFVETSREFVSPSSVRSGMYPGARHDAPSGAWNASTRSTTNMALLAELARKATALAAPA